MQKGQVTKFMSNIDKLVAIRIQQGSNFHEIPICALASNIYWKDAWTNNNINLVQVLGNIDVENKGTVQAQLNNKANITQLQNYINGVMHTDIENWLSENITTPEEGHVVLVNPSLTISGQAADAKVTGDYIRELQSQVNTKTSLDEVTAYITGNIKTEVEEWLDANVTLPPSTGILIDSSLTMSGQAADAKTTGDKFADLQDNLDSFYPSATAANVGDALTVKAITNGKVSEWELGLPKSKNGFSWNLLNNTASLSSNDIAIYSSESYAQSITMKNGVLTIYARNNGQTQSQWVSYNTGVLKQSLNGIYTFSFEMYNFSNYNTSISLEDLLSSNLQLQYGYKGSTSSSNNTIPFNNEFDQFCANSNKKIINQGNTSWQKYYITINLPNDFNQGLTNNIENNATFNIAFMLNNIQVASKYGYSVSLRNFKLQQGFLSTEWTPSVTDLELVPEEQQQVYVHVRYSNDGGAHFTTDYGADPGSWVGFYYDTNENDNTDDPNVYKWVSVEGDIQGDTRGFTWNRLKEEDINISSDNHLGMNYAYQKNGWFHISGHPSQDVQNPNPQSGVHVPLYLNNNGLIDPLEIQNYTLSAEIEGEFLKRDSSFLLESSLYLIYRVKANPNIFEQIDVPFLEGMGNIISIPGSKFNEGKILTEIGHYYRPQAGGEYNTRIRLMLAPGENFRSWTPSQEDLHAVRVSLSTESYVFPKIDEDTKINTFIMAYKNNTRIPTNILSVIDGIPDGMTVSVLNNNSTATELEIIVSPSMSSMQGILTIPVYVNYQSYNLTFTYTVAKQGTDNIYYCTCADAANSSTKNISCSTIFAQYTKGMLFLIDFSNGQNPLSGTNKLQFKIGDNGAVKTVCFNNEDVSSTNQFCWTAGTKILFMYDGYYFVPVGHPNTYYGQCSTNASTSLKECSIKNFVLCKGVNVIINFENTTSTTPTLNISSTGTYNIKAKGANLTRKYYWNEKSTVSFTFNGSQFELDNTTVYDQLHQVIINPNEPVGKANGDLWINSGNGNLLSCLINNTWSNLPFSGGAILNESITADKMGQQNFIGNIEGNLRYNKDPQNKKVVFNISKYKSEKYQNNLFDTSIEIKNGNLISRVKENLPVSGSSDNTNLELTKYTGVGLNNGRIEFNTPYPSSSTPSIMPQAINANNEYVLDPQTTRTAYINYTAPLNGTVYSPRLTIGTDDPIHFGTSFPLTAQLSKTDSFINSQSITLNGLLVQNGNMELYSTRRSNSKETFIDFHIPRLSDSRTTVEDFDTRIISRYENRKLNDSNYQDLTSPEIRLQVRYANGTTASSNPSGHTGKFNFKPTGIEIYPAAPIGATNSGSRGYIDFHFNGGYDVTKDEQRRASDDQNSSDYNFREDFTSRIIEISQGTLQIQPNLKVPSGGTIQGTLANSSDERLKKDIINIESQYLDLLNKIEVKEFRFKENDQKLNVGFIAQDVLKIINETNIKDQSFVSLDTSDKEYYTINYIQFIPILVKKCQQQDKKIKELEEKINNIKRYEQ